MGDFTGEFRQAFQNGSRYEDLCRLTLEYLQSPIASVDARWHPLGFIDFPIAQRGGASLTKISIHVWHPHYARPQRPQQICHSHGWNLFSVVLAGSLQNRIFEVRNHSRGNGRVYEVVYTGSTSDSNATKRRVRAEILHTEVYSARDSYTLSADKFHWTVMSDSLLATVMFSDLAHETRSYVVWPWSAATTYRYERRSCSDEEKRAILSDVVAAIGLA
jgi:hypothetical protein